MPLLVDLGRWTTLADEVGKMFTSSRSRLLRSLSSPTWQPDLPQPATEIRTTNEESLPKQLIKKQKRTCFPFVIN